MDLLEAFRAWKGEASNDDEILESRRMEFVRASRNAMLTPLLGERLDAVEECWSATEEGEELADFARERVDLCLQNLERLAKSILPAVRWQVYDVLGSGGGVEAEALLRSGLNDPDAYCRRRALLALIRRSPSDSASLIRQALNDADPYLREVAGGLANEMGVRL